MTELLESALIASILAAAIRLLTPILLAAIGELVAETSGVMNLGVEGTMLTGCFVGFLVAFATGSAPLAIMAAVFAGALLGLITSIAIVTLRIEQFVVGLAINLLCSALTAYAFRAFLQEVTPERAIITPLSTIRIPGLADIPLIGPALFEQTVLTYLTYIAVPLVAFWLHRTHQGLQMRCLGENPKLVDMTGASVARRRYAAIVFGGAMAGLAGASLSVGSSMRFVEEMSGGRGWLAIVAVVAANWRPARVPLVALAFAILQAIQIQAQATGSAFPYEVLLALPYVAAIGLMVVFRASSRMPAALGEPYVRH
jgi:simple sugar transport system permease protein